MSGETKKTQKDEFSCACCGDGLLDDATCCPACEAMECGEQDAGSDCKWSDDYDRRAYNYLRWERKAVTP